MAHTISTLRRAQKELVDLPAGAYERIRDAIRALSEGPRPSGCRQLVGRDGWRIWVGDYRVIYEADGDRRTVTMLHIGHRRDAYL